MDKKHFFILVTFLIIFSLNGCTGSSETQVGKGEVTIKEISINGIDKYEEVSSEEPVKLEVDGINVTVKIIEGTEVKRIDINGNDMTIILPEGANPEIDDNGINTEIKYRK